MLISHIKNCAILKNGKSGKPIDPIISNSNCANNVQIVDLLRALQDLRGSCRFCGVRGETRKTPLKGSTTCKDNIIYIYPQSGYIGKNKKDQWTLSVSHQLLLFCKKGHVTSMSSLQCNCFFCQLSQHSLAAFSLPWGHFVLARYDNPHGPHGAWFSKIPSFGTASNWGMQPSSLCHVSMTPV